MVKNRLVITFQEPSDIGKVKQGITDVINTKACGRYTIVEK